MLSKKNNFLLSYASIYKKQRSKAKRRLTDVAYLAKDNFWTENLPTTVGSKLLADFRPGENATVINLLTNQGAILIGKTTMDEFACGGTGLLSSTGIITNPYDSQHIAGGSSSGSAVAVAKGLVSFALGSDTGGSVRQPAAYCGVVGFKPSSGLVSRYGLVPMSSSLDTVGILAESMLATQTAFSIISRPDPADLLTITSTQISVKAIPFVSTKKIAVLRGIEKYLSSEFAKLYQKAINVLKRKNYQLKEIEIPREIRENLQLCYLIICSSELASHLNSCQGITYGQKVNDTENIGEKVCQLRTEYLGKSVRQRLLLGSYFLQNKADCERAYNFRQKVKNWADKIFHKYDFLLLPSPNSEAPKVEHSTFFFIGSEVHWSDNLLLLASLGGFPSLSLPIGFVNKLPVSININAAYRQDKLLLQLGELIEKELKIKNV